MTGKGLLLVLTDPAPSLEEELNDWYDTEHLPERAVIPGFETALRFTSLGDGPRYAAVYDLTTLDVLEGEAYRAVSGENFSPWTRRVTGRSRPVRMTARQAEPGGAVTGPCSRLLLVKFDAVTHEDVGLVGAGLNASFAGDPALLQYRIFVGVEPAPDFVVAIAEFAGEHAPPLRMEAFGDCRRRLVLASLYRPYRV